MAAIPHEGSRVILTLTDHRQVKGTVGVEVQPGKVTFKPEGASTYEAIRWADVWSVRVIEEGEGRP